MGELIVVSQVGQSQLQNKEKAIEKFLPDHCKKRCHQGKEELLQNLQQVGNEKLEKKRIHAAKKYLGIKL
jgi:hypothetical protein